MEQIRIIKEMRENDIRRGRTGSSVRPRYMVWENVPGAFSSNKGEDFRVVLEETAKVADKDAVIPSPPKGKWTTAGCVMGDGWSIAWRVLDAQFYGVPQRRRRIALVADFGGESASEILFVRKSVSRDTEQGEQERQTTSSDVTGSTGADNRCNGAITKSAGFCHEQGSKTYGIGYEEEKSPTLRSTTVPGTAYTLKIRSGCEGGGKGALIQTDKSATLSTLQDQTLFQPVVACDRSSFNQGKNAQYDFDINESGVASTLVAKGSSAVCYSIDEKCANTYVWEEQANTLAARDYKQPQAVCYSIDQGGGKSSASVSEGKTATLTCTHGGEPAVCYSMGIAMQSSNGINSAFAEKMPTLVNGSNPGYQNGIAVCYGIGSYHSNAWKSDNPHSGVYEADTAKTLDALNCGYPACNQGGIAVVQPNMCYWDGGQITGTLTANNASGSQRMPDKENFNCVIQNVAAVDCRNCTENPQTNGTLQAHNAGGTSLNLNNVVRIKYMVRRLTPLECERLQGYPDGWTDIGEWVDSKGKTHKTSDASRYKALGNSIAIPPWKWVMKRISACYERDATLASLFDGIGGFPYIWEQINGKGSCLWASEIEEYPIAVTKMRIGGEDNG